MPSATFIELHFTSFSHAKVFLLHLAWPTFFPRSSSKIKWEKTKISFRNDLQSRNFHFDVDDNNVYFNTIEWELMNLIISQTTWRSIYDPWKEKINSICKRTTFILKEKWRDERENEDDFTKKRWHHSLFFSWGGNLHWHFFFSRNCSFFYSVGADCVLGQLCAQ